MMRVRFETVLVVVMLVLCSLGMEAQAVEKGHGSQHLYWGFAHACTGTIANMVSISWNLGFA